MPTAPNKASDFPREEPGLPSSSDASRNHLLSQIKFLLWILAVAIFVTFCHFASSICIAVLLSSFLAIVIDPLIMLFERWRIPRVISSAVVIVGITALVGFLAYLCYLQAVNVVSHLPQYVAHIDKIVAPITNKLRYLETNAGRLNVGLPANKIPEVRVASQYPTWTSYVIHGVGSVSGVVVIGAIVPFLMFFLLIQKNRLKQKLAIVWGDRMDVSEFATRVTEMLRAFLLGNLLIALFMATVTIVALAVLHVKPAVPLGFVSGALNLIPFVGAVFGAIIPVLAALFQDQPLSTLLIIVLIVVSVHLISQDVLVPRIIGGRVSISPVAATVGILFWGWLWGLIGVLLAVPLTALIKIIADANPSLSKIANLLAQRPVAVPPWSRRIQSNITNTRQSER
jgi:predicted PurR-regulated permease PerM